MTLYFFIVYNLSKGYLLKEIAEKAFCPRFVHGAWLVGNFFLIKICKKAYFFLIILFKRKENAECAAFPFS